MFCSPEPAFDVARSKPGRSSDTANVSQPSFALRSTLPGAAGAILMTTSALILAMLPLALKLGEGGEWRAPMAVTVLGGLVTSTLLTLLVVPSVYTIVDDAQAAAARLPRRIDRLLRRWSTSREEPGLAPAPVAGSAE
jgi:AcrB/AcrD/AcrF family